MLLDVGIIIMKDKMLVERYQLHSILELALQNMVSDVSYTTVKS